MQNKVTQSLNLDSCRFFQILHFEVLKKRQGWRGIIQSFFFSPFFLKLNTTVSHLHFFFVSSLFLISLKFQPLFPCLVTRCYSQYDKSCTFYAKLFDTF